MAHNENLKNATEECLNRVKNDILKRSEYMNFIQQEKTKNALQVLLKEAEFIRAETLICVAVIRKISFSVITIIGLTVPILASVLSFRLDGDFSVQGDSINSFRILMSAIEANNLILVGVTTGAGAAIVALLRVYLGVMRQIFNFAKYFREILYVEINSLEQSARKLLSWEVWLKEKRSSRFHVGDSDLSAEPILISVSAFLVGSMGVVFAQHNAVLLTLSTIFLLVILLIVAFSLRAMLQVLKN